MDLSPQVENPKTRFWPNKAKDKYLFKTLRFIVLLNATGKVCLKKPPSNILVLVLFYTQLTLRKFSFWKNMKKNMMENLFYRKYENKTVENLFWKNLDRNIELTLNESRPLIEKAWYFLLDHRHRHPPFFCPCGNLQPRLVRHLHCLSISILSRNHFIVKTYLNKDEVLAKMFLISLI